MSAERDLIDAVSDSIVSEVDEADQWMVEKFDPMWRNPKKGKVLNVYVASTRPGTARWTGGQEDIIDVTVEYGEPAPEQVRNLDRDEEAELAATDIAASLRTWALAHEAGFSPAWKMDWAGTDFTPNVRRELFVRYCRLTFRFTLTVEYG